MDSLQDSNLPVASGDEWQLKTLSPKHKQAMALLAQGLDRVSIAEYCQFTPEYITMLARQPLCRAYLKEMSDYADAQLVGLSEASVGAIADTLRLGTADERLKAARLQMEATGRIGRGRPDENVAVPGQLEALAERLTSLLSKARKQEDIEDVQIIETVQR